MREVFRTLRCASTVLMWLLAAEFAWNIDEGHSILATINLGCIALNTVSLNVFVRAESRV